VESREGQPSKDAKHGDDHRWTRMDADSRKAAQETANPLINDF